MGSDSDSSSDDDNLALLREAADTEFINDKMFQSDGTKEDEAVTSTKSASAPKSQRYIADDNQHIDDQLIPEEVQKFVSKKLAKILDDRLEFVDVRGDGNASERSERDAPIRLLNDVVLDINWTADESVECDRRKKPKITKRRLPDVDDAKSELERLKAVAVDVGDVSNEVTKWKTTPKGRVFQYISNKNGKLCEVEADTEFSEKRRRNNWDESKISKKK